MQMTLIPHVRNQLLTCFLFFFFNDTATTEIYTLSLHDALPICSAPAKGFCRPRIKSGHARARSVRSEEHTSELQSLAYLVCRLLLEKKIRFRRYVCTESALSLLAAHPAAPLGGCAGDRRATGRC